MKIKLIFLVFITLIPSACYADSINNELRKIIKGLFVSNGVELISYQDNQYIVSVADADINSNAPIDKLNAMKVAKQISEAHISRFVNGEDIYIKEKLHSIRVVKSNTQGSKYVRNEDIYEELIKNKSSGVLRNMKNIRWVYDNVYYVAALLKL